MDPTCFSGIRIHHGDANLPHDSPYYVPLSSIAWFFYTDIPIYSPLNSLVTSGSPSSPPWPSNLDTLGENLSQTLLSRYNEDHPRNWLVIIEIIANRDAILTFVSHSRVYDDGGVKSRQTAFLYIVFVRHGWEASLYMVLNIDSVCQGVVVGEYAMHSYGSKKAWRCPGLT
jgi:hypothetical protein